jgi:signal transduction histidine kinase
VLATLEERQRLARELHDGLGQILGYVSMQAQAVRKWVRDGDAATAEAQLLRQADIARGAQEDIRQSILCLKAPDSIRTRSRRTAATTSGWLSCANAWRRSAAM